MVIFILKKSSAIFLFEKSVIMALSLLAIKLWQIWESADNPPDKLRAPPKNFKLFHECFQYKYNLIVFQLSLYD